MDEAAAGDVSLLRQEGAQAAGRLLPDRGYRDGAALLDPVLALHQADPGPHRRCPQGGRTLTRRPGSRDVETSA